MNNTLRKDMSKRIITYTEFKNLVSSLCRQITLSEWKPDYIVGISRGGLLPAVMISHYLNVPMRPLQVSLRDGGECVSDLGMAEDAYGYVNIEDREFNEGESSSVLSRKNILIVDDINDQGNTVNWILNDWPSGCMPNDKSWETVWNNNVKFAVLFDNLASNASIKMDFAGEEINKSVDDVWIEFPYEEWWTK
jgi:xanthine phosphoribosyltransferase